LGVLAQRDLLETVEGRADVWIGHSGEAWSGSDRTILPAAKAGRQKKPPRKRGFTVLAAFVSAMQLAGRLRLVLDRQHAQVERAVARHRPVDALAHAQAEQGAADRGQDRDA